MNHSRPLPRWRFVLLAGALALAAGDAFGQSARDLDNRIERLEERLSGSALMGLMNDSSRLTDEVSGLRGEIELIQRELSEIKDQQRALYLDLDSRLQALETGGIGTNTDNALPTMSEPGTVPPEEPAGDPAADYEAAFNSLRSGNFAQARQQFEQFLTAYPDDDLTANARYWLGESFYAERNFTSAIAQFQAVLDDYPDSNKHPDALLKIGFSHLEQGRQLEAERVLEQLVSEHPQSTAASLAAQRLQQF